MSIVAQVARLRRVIGEIGSPRPLVALLADLKRRDRALDRRAAPAHLPLRRATEAAYAGAVKLAQIHLELRAMRRVVLRFAERLGLAGESASVTLIDDLAARTQGSLDKSLDLAGTCRPGDFFVRILRGRERELAGDLAGAMAAYDPPAGSIGHGAYDVYRRGEFLLRAGERAEAARMFTAALSTAPTLALACRRHAEGLRAHSPREAARHYAQALEYSPALTYGGFHRDAIGRYREFLLFRSGDACTAVSAVFGRVSDVTDEAARALHRRLFGLLLLKLRAALRKHPRPLQRFAASDDDDGVEASFWTRLSPGLGLRRKSQRLQAGIGGYATPIPLTVLNWLLTRSNSFHFALRDESEEAMRRQIDEIHARWLSTDKAG